MRAILLIGLFASFLLAVSNPFLDMTNEDYRVAEKKCSTMVYRAINETLSHIDRYGTADQKLSAYYATAEMKTLCIVTHGGYGTKFSPMDYETLKVLLKASAEQ